MRAYRCPHFLRFHLQLLVPGVAGVRRHRRCCPTTSLALLACQGARCFAQPRAQRSPSPPRLACPQQQHATNSRHVRGWWLPPRWRRYRLRAGGPLNSLVHGRARQPARQNKRCGGAARLPRHRPPSHHCTQVVRLLPQGLPRPEPCRPPPRAPRRSRRHRWWCPTFAPEGRLSRKCPPKLAVAARSVRCLGCIAAYEAPCTAAAYPAGHQAAIY
jgi:hypothetical protein